MEKGKQENEKTLPLTTSTTLSTPSPTKHTVKKPVSKSIKHFISFFFLCCSSILQSSCHINLLKFTSVIFFFVFVFHNTSYVSASKPIVLENDLQELCISREYVEYFEDSSGRMSINDVIDLQNKIPSFIPSTAEDLVNENTKSAYWLRFYIKNNTHKPFRIELFDFDIDEISIFYPDSTGIYTELEAGFRFPFSYREVKHKNVSFYIPEKISSSSYTYMRFRSEKRNVLEPMVRSYDRVLDYALSEYLFFGIFYGLLILIIFYNLIYFLILQRAYYFYFVLYGLGILLYLASCNGTGFQYIWYNYPHINDYTGETGLFIGTLSMMLFTSHFLKLKQQQYPHYRFLVLLGISRIGFYIIQLVYPHYDLFEVFDLLCFLIVSAIVVQLYLQKKTSSQWLMLAYITLNISFIIRVLEQLTIVPSGILSVYSVNLGIILQFVFLSIGIAETVKEVYREKNEAQSLLILQLQQNESLKDKVNRELEKKVEERTVELAKANEDLKKKAEENTQINLALDLANSELKRHMSSFAQSSITKDYLDFHEFKKAYPDEISCTRYLRELKDKKGFLCIKCGNDKSIKGKEKFDIRCSKCNYNESVTANTIFHRTKLPLQKAFYMLYVISQKRSDTNASELAKNLDLQPATCQFFKKKALYRLKGKNLSWEHIVLD